MIAEKDKLLSTIDDLKNYVNLKIRIVALTLGENSARIFATIISNWAIIFFIALFLFFGSFALAFGLGAWLNSTGLGFVIVAGLYLLFAVIVFLCRSNYIERPLTNFFIKHLFKNSDEDDA